LTLRLGCDEPRVVELLEHLLAVIMDIWPQARVTAVSMQETAGDGARRGGPCGTPKSQRQEVVEGWLRLRGRMNQEVYAQGRGISPATLRRWMRELRDADKL
jgi:hypothetical protein